MGNRRTSLLGVLAVALVGLPARGADDPTPTAGMTESLDVDLTKDPRKDFKTRGTVEWEAGRLTLAPDAGLTRTLDGLGQARVTLRLAFPPLTENGQASTTRFAFQVRDRGDFVVELVRKRANDKVTGEVRLIDRDAPGPEGKTVTRTLRTVPWTGDFPDAAWVVRHHFGLVTVHRGEQLVVAGHSEKEPLRQWVGRTRFPPPDQAFYKACGINEPLEVVGWSLEQAGQPVACTGVSGRASTSYRKGLDAYWQKTLVKKDLTKLDFHVLSTGVSDEANLRVRAARRVVSRGQDHDALQEMFDMWRKGEPDEEMLGGHDSSLHSVVHIFGKKHHYYAIGLAGVAAQYFWAGFEKDLVVAERLLKQAVEISEAAVGIWHPDCLAVTSALARLYVKTGKADLAEPLLKKVAEAAQVFGAESAASAASLRELATQHRYKGRFADSETTLKRAVAASKGAPVGQVAATLIELGELEIVLGEREKAADVLKRADELLDAEIQRRWNEPPAGWKPLAVDLARARALRARLLLRDGKRNEARQLTRGAFQFLVQFWDQAGTGPGRFPRWDAPWINVTPDTQLFTHPSYTAVMIDIVEVFALLGDVVPATNGMRVVDQVPGQTRHDRGVLFRAMAKLCEADPNVQIGIRPGFSERMRLDTVFQLQTRELTQDLMGRPKKGVTPPDRAEYWQKLALKELEGFAGREHPDTIRLLVDQATRQWKVSGPKAAEATLRDAMTRTTTLLSDRVLAGLPEAQAYQFLEVNQPPIDLLLSCYQATKEERGREAYEAVWQAKALATRQLAERRQLVQAAVGNPELTKLADQLQATRQQLAQLTLSTPPEGAAEGRRQQLAKLVQQKEDLERELARLSEPLRRTRETNRATVADMVGRLPANTAVVDFVERWPWEPPTAATMPLPVGSVWTGEKYRKETDKTMPATLKITERDGINFRGEFTFDTTNVNAVAGTISGDAIEWHVTKVLKGNEHQPTKGTLKDGAIDATFRVVTRSGARTFTANGTVKLTAERPAKAAKAPDPPKQSRCYDAFVLRPTKAAPGWSVAWVPLGDADAVDRLLDEWNTTLRPGKLLDAKVTGELRRRLWDPIEKSLAGCERVIVIPDGRLAQLPWVALPGRKPNTYLLEDYALGQAPYGQLVARVLTDPAPEGSNFLVVGGIDYGPGGKWTYLQGTTTEAELLEKLRAGPTTARLSGTDATKTRLRELLPSQRYIHLATHGDFLEPASSRDRERLLAAQSPAGGSLFDVSARNPLLLSMLVLAGANNPAKTDAQGLPVGSDSFLTAEEVMGLNLMRAELVVLSACETGVGKVRGNEGTFSLQRAFHVAGSRAVVASLWKVPDSATQALMVRFHENLLKGRDGKPMGKLDALREAQLWLLKEAQVKPELVQRGLKREHVIEWKRGDPVPPYYWAAFVFSGDWR